MGCTSSSVLGDSTDSGTPEDKPSQLQVITDGSSAVVDNATTDGSAQMNENYSPPEEKEKEEKYGNLVEKGEDNTASSGSSSPQVAPDLQTQTDSTIAASKIQAISRDATKPITSLPPLKKGFILKEGHLIKNWRNRFFVLEAGTMTYYESSTDVYPYGVRKKGEIILKGTTLKMSNNIISITYDGDVTSREGLSKLTLEIRYPTEREEWFQAIRNHITYFNAADLSE